MQFPSLSLPFLPFNLNFTLRLTKSNKNLLSLLPTRQSTHKTDTRTHKNPNLFFSFSDVPAGFTRYSLLTQPSLPTPQSQSLPPPRKSHHRANTPLPHWLTRAVRHKPRKHDHDVS